MPEIHPFRYSLREYFAELNRPQNPIAMIQETVAAVSGVPLRNILSRRQDRRTVDARYVAMKITEDRTNLTSTQIGALYGRERTSVEHALNSHWTRVKRRDYAMLYQAANAQLGRRV